LFYFSEPIWLWISAGIVVPILIHLAKGQAGKTLRIGSIRLIRENIISQSSSLKIRERLLLLLRCLGILLAAFFLAAPAWKHPFTSRNAKGWILLERNRPAHSLEPYHVLIDSLVSRGFELRVPEKDFPKTRLDDTVSISMDSTRMALSGYWQLLKDLEKKLPAGLPVYLFTGNQLSRFTGPRPDLSLNLQWFFLNAPDTTGSWISRAWSTSADSIRKITGNSRPSVTWFQTAMVPHSEYDAILKGENILTDTNTLMADVYGESGNPDADYIYTALQAVRQYTDHRIKISFIHHVDSLHAHADWIFWLSDKAFPASLHPRNLFMYENGEPVNSDSHIYTRDGAEPDGTALYLTIRSSTDSLARNIWTDGTGRPLLTRIDKKFIRYRFYSRIDPAWNDLPWSAALPRFILQLLYPEEISNKDLLRDQRKIDPRQAIPALRTAGLTTDKMIYQHEDLSRYFWVLLLLLFCGERFLSLKKKGSFRNE
jgi:Aerotolerance regulator N-terminal